MEIAQCCQNPALGIAQADVHGRKSAVVATPTNVGVAGGVQRRGDLHFGKSERYGTARVGVAGEYCGSLQGGVEQRRMEHLAFRFGQGRTQFAQSLVIIAPHPVEQAETGAVMQMLHGQSLIQR